ncbi:MAG: cation:proton antiporter [Candidatus Coatesbacteria bacterium]|nr:cation:proton antiporter [Candidatus Coatesbacteria bacterium]
MGAQETAQSQPERYAAITFLRIALVLLAAKVFSSLIKLIKQPPVLGELLAGVLLGNLPLLGVNVLQPLGDDPVIDFLARLGVVVLLFQIGLKSDIREMKSVGVRAFLVACIGVAVPFVLGTVVLGPLLLKGSPAGASLFLGAALTATSVGITARIFGDLNRLDSPEAQIVLGAAVIDDVLGLIILAVVSAIATAGAVSYGAIGFITGKAVAFFAGSIIIGLIIAPLVGKALSRLKAGVGLKFTLAISFGLAFAYVAEGAGLAPIVGAFTAGLILAPVQFLYFKDPKIVLAVKGVIKDASVAVSQRMMAAIEPHSNRRIGDLIEPLGYFLVPVFFVMTGYQVKLAVFVKWHTLLIALAITLVAFGGKIVAGIGAFKADKLVVGFGMIPRGEVGLIFAMTGRLLGVVSQEIFSAIVAMVMLSTLLTPPLLTWLLRRKGRSATSASDAPDVDGYE